MGGRWGQVWQIPSPYGVGGETCYTAQEDLKFINRYNVGEGRTVRVWFFSSYIPGPSLILASLSSLGQHIPPSLFFRDNSLAPFDTLLMSNYLPISLLRHLGTQSQRKRGDAHSGFFRLYRGIVGLWVPFACSLSGSIYGGRGESTEQ